mgnify:CR=1 FL=1
MLRRACPLRPNLTAALGGLAVAALLLVALAALLGAEVFGAPQPSDAGGLRLRAKRVMSLEEARTGLAILDDALTDVDEHYEG